MLMIRIKLIRSMTNRKGELCPPKYVHKKFVGKDDLANINPIMVFDTINRCNKDTERGGANSKTNTDKGGDDDKDDKKKLQKKYQATVAKATKQLVASLIEAE